MGRAKHAGGVELSMMKGRAELYMLKGIVHVT